MKPKKLSASQLKQTLWDTLEALKAGEISVAEVTAVANISREITRTTNTQLKISMHTGRELPKEIIDFSEDLMAKVD